MKKSNIDLSKLESQMVSYRELINVPVIPCRERFVSLGEFAVPHGYIGTMTDMKELFGQEVPVRRSVAKRLSLANEALKKEYPNLKLFVTYGYRSLVVQTNLFLQELKKSDFLSRSLRPL